jgi:hypothetical protein
VASAARVCPTGHSGELAPRAPLELGSGARERAFRVLCFRCVSNSDQRAPTTNCETAKAVLATDITADAERNIGFDTRTTTG